jgi:hypothetical protein
MERITQDTPKGASLILDNPKTDEEAREQVRIRFMDALNILAAYERTGKTPEEVAALVQAESERRIIPKEAHQPSFVKYDAIDIFDQWNDTTGALDKGTSWYCEIQSIIEEVAAMAFGAGVIYQSEASAALSEMGEQE